MEQLSKARCKCVGTKQTLKALEKKEAKTVYIAQDADAHVTEPLIKMCQEQNVPLVRIPTMSELGKACEIKVGCASAAILSE